MYALPALMRAQTSPAFRPYMACTFEDGLALTEHSPLPGGVQGRTVETTAGARAVALVGGQRLVFSYPGTDPFANVKVEQLPAASFAQGKHDLIGNFDHVLASGDDSERNMEFALKPQLNGFEVYGLDRKKMEGATLGIYLLIDNRTHIVTSIYLLNQDATRRKFASPAQYAQLRDRFLDAYSGCIHAPYAAPALPKAKAKSARRHR